MSGVDVYAELIPGVGVGYVVAGSAVSRDDFEALMVAYQAQYLVMISNAVSDLRSG